MDTSFIFYLQMTNSLQDFYIHLASKLARDNIKLIPVSINNLKDFINSKKITILVLNDSLLTNRNYKILKRKYLDFMLINQKIEIIEFAAFEKPNSMSRVESQGLFHYFSLPATIDGIVLETKKIVKKDKEQRKEWPGGKRSNFRVTM